MGNVLIQNLNQFPSHIPKYCISSDDVYALNASCMGERACVCIHVLGCQIDIRMKFDV